MAETGPPRATEAAGFAAALADPGLPPPPSVGEAQARRFAVHRNAAVVTMIEALAASFPAVERLVGPEFFAALARAYLEAEPPSSPLLFRYGAGLPGFIERFAPAARLPYLADVARLDWLWLQAYHAADRAPLAVSALGEVEPEALGGLRLELHPSLRLLASRFPVVSLWAASTDRGESSAVDMRRAERAAVIRPGLSVDVRATGSGAHALLASLAAGAPLGEAAVAATDAEPAADLGEQINALFAIGAVVAIKRPDTS